MIPIDTIITTTRCVLRIPDESDFDMIFSASRYAGFNEGMQWEPPQSKDELWTPLKNSLKSWEEGSGYSFTIVSKDTDSVSYGRISIRVTEEPGKWNIGYWIHPEYQGRGLMTECVEGIVSFGFNTLGAHTITANVTTWNKASEKVLINNGFKFSHHIPQGIKKRGAWVAENSFTLLCSSRLNRNITTPECDFCNVINDHMNSIYEDERFVILLDIDPISVGHVLICPKDHYAEFHDMPDGLLQEMILLAKKYSKVIMDLFTDQGYSMMLNSGEFNDLGHCHLHLFPRYSKNEFTWVYDDSGVDANSVDRSVLRQLLRNHL